MPRRELLSPAHREALFALPTDEGELIRHYTLGADDLHLVRQHRGSNNQLGFAIQLCYLRFPGRSLGVDEAPPPQLIEYIAAQLNVSPETWNDYAMRDQTRREHLQELQRHFGVRFFTAADYRDLAGLITTLAMQTWQGVVLAEALINEMRRRRILLPPIAIIERLCAEAATLAQRRVYQALTERLNDEQRDKLERLIGPPSIDRTSKLAWLRSPVGAPNPRNVLGLIDRLKVIREIELPSDLARSVHQNRLLQLAREGAQTDVPHLRDFETARRHGTLVAMLLESTATLTDEILDMHDRIVGSAFAKAKRTYTTSFQESAKAINEKVRLYAKVGHALIEAKKADKDAFAAIEQIVSWEQFTQTGLQHLKNVSGFELDTYESAKTLWHYIFARSSR